jgi:hydantoinase/carbamoylase family amidase
VRLRPSSASSVGAALTLAFNESSKAMGGCGTGESLELTERVDPRRVIDDLERLRELTGTPAGAQRVAWTPTWAQAREWLLSELSELSVTVALDEAGNLWATLAGRDARSLVIGSHLDSVPDGGWLDGSLGVLAGLEVLRAFASGPTPQATVQLVDWADEEGARFGRSLFGSSAAAGLLEPDIVGKLTDADGVGLADAVAEYGVALERTPWATRRLLDVASYIELHIEQGPVLERAGLVLGVVEGVFGIERNRIRFDGQAAHAGSTPMDLRRDPIAAASRFVLEARRGAVDAGGVATVGEIGAEPGIPTAVPASATIVLDQRHGDAEQLRRMLNEVRAASQSISDEEGVSARWSTLQSVSPVTFDPRLVAVAEQCASAIAGSCMRLPSGALHDAAMLARAGVPTVMLFVQSIGGISHSRIEDSRRAHIEQGVAALELLARRLAV